MSWSSEFVRKVSARALALALCAGALTGCAAGPQPRAGGAGAPAREGAWGGFHVRYQPVPDPIPLNEVFKIYVTVADPADRSRPLAGAEVVAVAAEMPAHGHGMNLVPAVAPLSDGRFEVDGMLLHMPGHWVLEIEVSRAGERQRATFDVVLE